MFFSHCFLRSLTTKLNPMRMTLQRNVLIRDAITPSQGSLHPKELIRIRQLYLQKQYKHCIAACEQDLKLKLRPVHYAFLLFQQAVSYEALGLAAHTYSRNKIPFFESAKTKFREALDILPQPFASTEDGQPQPLGLSPITPAFTDIEMIPTLATSTPAFNEQCTEAVFDMSSASSDSTITQSVYSVAYSAPDFDRYSPRPDQLAVPTGIPRTITFPDIDQQDRNESSESEDGLENPDALHNNLNMQDPKYGSRLSTTLSSTHALADELIPSPLFSRTKKTTTIPFPDLDISNDISTFPQTPCARPTPFSTSHTIISLRKTAVQTLISKFEHQLPLTPILSPRTPTSQWTDASISPSARNSTPYLSTPITSRFNLIKSTFNPKPTHLDPNALPFLTSRTLTRYNIALSSFRTAIITSIATTGNIISTTSEAHERHMESKRRTFLASFKNPAGTRLASYWLLATPAPHPTRCVHRGEKSESAVRGGVGGEENETIKKKRERIEKLRAEGFRVRKEKWGWKGKDHYEELRGRVERELICGL